MSEPHVAHTKPLNRTQNLTESSGRLASQADVFRGARLSSLVGRDGRRAPLKMPAWETSGRRTVTIPVFDKSAKRFWLNAVLNAEGRPQGTHTMCVCNSLLFYSKCSGFTVCFIYNDISLSMYINQCKTLYYLTYGISSSFYLKSGFLRDFDGFWVRRLLQDPPIIRKWPANSNSFKISQKTVLRQKDDDIPQVGFPAPPPKPGKAP